jgi:hypothetical protein
VVLGKRLLLAGSGASFTVPLPTNLTAIYNGKLGAVPQEIYIATSTDAGASFTIGNGGDPLIPAGAGGTWNDGHVAHASVILEGAVWAIYASGYDGATWRTGRWTAATLSDDPADWTPDAGNPIIGPGSAGAFDEDGAFVPHVQYDASAGLTRIWYTGIKDANFSGGYAERSSGGTITKYGEVLPKGSGGAWNEIGTSPTAPHTIGGQKRLFLGGQNAGGTSSAGWASYTDPRSAATYTNQGEILEGPITVADGSYDSVAITSILPYGVQYLVFGSLIHPTGSGNQREIAYRVTSPDGITFGTPTGEVIPLSTAHPNVESAENPSVVLTP